MPGSAGAGAGSTTSPIIHTGLTPLMHPQVAVNHLCETIWLPLDAPRTCSPRFNPIRPSPLLPRGGTAALPLRKSIDLCCRYCCCWCWCSPPPNLPARPCSFLPVLLCPRAPLPSCQQRDISTCALALALLPLHLPLAHACPSFDTFSNAAASGLTCAEWTNGETRVPREPHELQE